MQKPLHEDADIVVVAKPPGIAVIPARGEAPEACLQKRLESARGERLFVVHRIDRETSGLVVFARHAEAHRALSIAFERREVRKEYVAFVVGAPAESGSVTAALADARRGRSRPARPGETGAREALTEFAREREWSSGEARVARLRVSPRTGRHHQIRVHLRFAGTPILGDSVYGRATLSLAERLGASRLALHASRLVMPWLSGSDAGMNPAPVPWGLRREQNSSAPNPPGGSDPGMKPASPARLELSAPLWPDLEALQARLDSDWSA